MSSTANIICPSCGIVFGVPQQWMNARTQDKKSFFCPNGHGQSFRESETDILRRERDRLKQQLVQKDDDLKCLRAQKEEAEKRTTAAKGQVTRLKNRAKAGVCPCCNRTFSNMTEHMKTKHPDFDPKVVDLSDVRSSKRA